MRKVFSVIIFICLTLFSNSLQCKALELKSENNSEIQVYSDILEWRYKVINGRLYKRLYNTTKDSWIGDWILA